MAMQKNVPADLKADCANCLGLCCTALYFSASEGFPRDKPPGEPCTYLQDDSRCGIYPDLKKRGFKGCMAFDCFGAGQKVARISFPGVDWRTAAASAPAMFEVFLVIRQLHEMLWYLNDALTRAAARAIYPELQAMLDATEELTRLSPDALLHLDVDAHRQYVNDLLLQTSELVRNEILQLIKNHSRPKKLHRGALLMGADLRKSDIRGANLRGACLIAADLRGTDFCGTDVIGADFRDTDIRGTDLSQALFLTQAQINAARGDAATRLPVFFDYPRSWDS